MTLNLPKRFQFCAPYASDFKPTVHGAETNRLVINVLFKQPFHFCNSRSLQVNHCFSAWNKGRVKFKTKLTFQKCLLSSLYLSSAHNLCDMLLFWSYSELQMNRSEQNKHSYMNLYYECFLSSGNNDLHCMVEMIPSAHQWGWLRQSSKYLFQI